MNFTETDRARFWTKVDRLDDDSCWPWMASLDNQGYGKFGIHDGDRQITACAHRIAYEMEREAIPDGMFIDHTCRNRRCANPRHLRLATPKQNSENLGGATVRSKSGVRGVSWHAKRQQWHASVCSSGKRHFIGVFASIEDAEAAVVAARNSLFTHNDADRVAG